MNINFFEEASRLQKNRISFASATIINASGSTPRTQAKMLITVSGETIGTIGGGLAESFVIEEAKMCLASGTSKIVSYRLDNGEDGNSIGMLCGGNLDVFVEVILPAKRIVLIGGGHVNLQIAEFAAKLGYVVEVVETREEFCTLERFPMAAALHYHEDIRKAVALVSVDANCAVIIATHDHDGASLEELITGKAYFIGMLGSRRKVAVLKKDLLAKGFDKTTIDKLRAPTGLDIGSETPEEIAVSILAEIMMVQNEATGRPLMQRGAKNLVIVRGAGDIASGTIHRLIKAGYRVLALETEQPTVIRRPVSFASAVYERSVTVEGVTAVLVQSMNEAKSVMDRGDAAVLIDPEGAMIKHMVPDIVVDAVLAKRNLGTNMDMAPIVVGLGPGFTAGEDVHAVVETSRGHFLGKVYYEGSALSNTGIPGIINGYGEERVIRSPGKGEMQAVKKIGDLVEVGDVVAEVSGEQVVAAISGVIRGMLCNSLMVTKGFKIGDIDPRGNRDHCYSISDKARAVAGGVLEAVLHLSLMKPE